MPDIPRRRVSLGIPWSTFFKLAAFAALVWLWLQLVDVTVFLTHLERDFAVYNRIYAEYFGDFPPCRTTIGVARLPGPISIELKCIATVDD